VRAVRLLADVRAAKYALEYFVGRWPFDPTISIALDRLAVLEGQALDTIDKLAGERRRSA
jgi:hypothetical protein